MLGFLLLIATAFVLILGLVSYAIVYDIRNPKRLTAGYAAARNLPFDPGELGYKFENWILELQCGSGLPVWDISLGRDSKYDIAAVFVHDWESSRIELLSKLKMWDGIASRALIYDLRGHGEATASISRLGCSEHKDLLSMIDRLEDTKVVLVGYGMGAIIVQNAIAVKQGDSQIVAGILYSPREDFKSWLGNRLHNQKLPVLVVTELVMLWFRILGLNPGVVATDSQIERIPVVQFQEEFESDGSGNNNKETPEQHESKLRSFVDKVMS